jgi:hypothetical protein
MVISSAGLDAWSKDARAGTALEPIRAERTRALALCHWIAHGACQRVLAHTESTLWLALLQIVEDRSVPARGTAVARKAGVAPRSW